MKYMKLIVGLGNPGKEYNNTRHNIGFSFIDYYLNKKYSDIHWSKSFDGEYYTTLINNEKVIFVKPMTFMNLSGICVSQFMNYYNISIDDLLVVADDLDILLGHYKLKLAGSSGGHNGLKNIESCISSSSFKRLKIGISNDKTIDTKDYVLGRFSKEELDIYNNLFNELVDVIDDYFVLPFSDLMSKYNQKNR